MFDIVRMNKVTFNIKTLDAPINILGLPWAIVFLLWALQQMSPKGIVFILEVIMGRKQFLGALQHMSPHGIVFFPKVSFEEENSSLRHHKRCFPKELFSSLG
jgi:hypothetical protein